MSTQRPSIGQIVHVTSPSPGYRDGQMVCLPGLIDAVYDNGQVSLTVVNRGRVSGMTAPYDETAQVANSWHWPERVEAPGTVVA